LGGPVVGPQPGVRCFHRFPMRGEVAWSGEPGLPHGMTFGVWPWAYRRFGVVGCTSDCRCERMAGKGQAKPYRLPGPFGQGTPGSRWRGNPGLWKRSPAAGGRERRKEKVERRWFGRGLWRRLDASTSQLTLGRSPGRGCAAQPGVRCFHRFPMRRADAVCGEGGLPHGTTFGGWILACRRAGVIGCTSGVAGEGGWWGEVKRSPTGFRDHFGSGTPGSRWRGNPGLWKRSPSGNGPMEVVRADGGGGWVEATGL
jgi:hypothetical protein